MAVAAICIMQVIMAERFNDGMIPTFCSLFYYSDTFSISFTIDLTRSNLLDLEASLILLVNYENIWICAPISTYAFTIDRISIPLQSSHEKYYINPLA